jgi:hypothetical protein
VRNVKIPGAVDDIGAGQGYVGVSVLFTTEAVKLNGVAHPSVPVYKLVYQLEPHEVEWLREGGRVVLTVIGKPPIVPHRLEVQPS